MGLKAALLSVLIVGATAASGSARDGAVWRVDLSFAEAAASAPAFDLLLRRNASADVDAVQELMQAADAPRRVELSVVDAALFASPEFISVARSRFLERGGAHPETRVSAWTWDVAENRLAGISDFIQGQGGLETLVKILRERAIERAHDGEASSFWRAEIQRAIQADAALLANFTLAPSTETGRAAAIDFHYDPYVLAHYVVGPQKLRVSLRELEPLLTERARRIFSGAPAE